MNCARGEPPGASAVAPARLSNVGVATARQTASDSGKEGLSLSDAGITPAPSAMGIDSNRVDSSNQPEAQTDARPIASDPSFQELISLLCSAIIDENPEKAHAAFFPLVAYRQVKAIADPDRDYRLRLLSHFDRDINEYHRRLAKLQRPVKCLGLRVPESQARWMKPGSEYNRVGYFRVLRSQLGVVDAVGNMMSLEVTSLISWRGQWYVVHLNGFE